MIKRIKTKGFKTMTIINDDFKKNVGKRLQELQEQKGLTIKDIVELLSRDYYRGIDEKSIRRYINKKRSTAIRRTLKDSF